ncbi:MAG: hypothetical protein ACI3Y5_03165 [Prevotella sp.]
MDFINKHKLITLMIMLFAAITVTSCGDDDDFGNDEYASFIVGSWMTEEVDVVTHQPTGKTGRYVWTFNGDGTGVWVDAEGNSSTNIPSIVNEFRYTVKAYGEETGLWYDFCVDFVFLDANGEVAWTERMCFSKTGKSSCNMFTEGKTLSSVLKRK